MSLINRTASYFISIFFICISALIVLPVIQGCGSNRSKDIYRSDAGHRQFPEKISPNHCRIIGTVVEIDSALDKAAGNSPCSKVPCLADVKIDSVLGYGSDFPPLKLGKIIKVRFGFTLSPTTKDLFPHMAGYYPGLNINDSFKADLQKVIAIDSIRNKVNYIIYSYLKK